MESYTEEQIEYPILKGANYSNYGFREVNGKLIFSRYFSKGNTESWKKFIIANFRDIAECYYLAYKNDCELVRSRKRKLSSFLKRIWDQTEDVALLMIKAIVHLKDCEESDIIERIVRKILPGIGFVKTRDNGGKYKWSIDERKKFDSGIGKVLILTYIINSFNKDETWKYIKKNCYLKDGTWHYKSNVTCKRVEKILSNYILNGGIIVENVNMEFQTFVPMKVISKDATGRDRFIGKADDEKHLYVTGVASTTGVDWDTEKVSKKFIKKMKKQAVGLPLKVGSHFSSNLDDTVGVIVDKGGTEDTFAVEGKLQSFENNPNVLKIAQKMDDGIQFGFSIYGRVTKTYREKDEKMGKEVVVLDDGDLSHVLITDQPCNKETFAEGIVKSLVDKGEGKEKPGKDERRVVNEYKHSSAILKSEPEVSKEGEFPDQAYPVNFATKEVHKDYLHHYVHEGNLFLNKSWVVQAFNTAKERNAPRLVVNHLLNHLQVVGLQKEADDLVNLKNGIEELSFVKEKIDAFIEKIAEECKSKTSGVKSMEEKMKIINTIINEVAPKITKLVNSSEDS